MSDFTIEQLEALKEGADSAPWRPEYDEGDEHWVIAFDHPKFGGRWDKGIAHGEGAAKLFAAAPALVDALIAEKRKNDDLCQEIGSLIGKLETRAENAESNRAYASAVAFRESERDLARILKADNG